MTEKKRKEKEKVKWLQDTEFVSPDFHDVQINNVNEVRNIIKKVEHNQKQNNLTLFKKVTPSPLL